MLEKQYLDYTRLKTFYPRHTVSMRYDCFSKANMVMHLSVVVPPGQKLEKGGQFAVRSFVGLSHSNAHISPSHTVHNREICSLGTACEGLVPRLGDMGYL